MIQVIWFHFLRKMEQAANIFLGRWPTVFCIYTYRRVRRLPSSCLVHTRTAVTVQSAVSIHSIMVAMDTVLYLKWLHAECAPRVRIA